MARLFSRTNAGAVDDPEFGHFEPDPDHGGFDFPDELSDRLHAVHHRKKPAWETEIERDGRLHGEESARRRDPETLYNAVASIAGIAAQLASLQAGAQGGVPGEAKADVARLTAEVEALRAQLAEATAQGAGDGDDTGTAAVIKPSRSRKGAPAEA